MKELLAKRMEASTPVGRLSESLEVVSAHQPELRSRGLRPQALVRQFLGLVYATDSPGANKLADKHSFQPSGDARSEFDRVRIEDALHQWPDGIGGSVQSIANQLHKSGFAHIRFLRNTRQTRFSRSVNCAPDASK